MQKNDQEKCRKNSSCLRVKYFVKNVPKYLSYLIRWRVKPWMSSNGAKRGHFSVVTSGNGESKKFVVGLRYLSYPPFVRLLEAAEREYGFEQKGLLTLPCEASELQQMLSQCLKRT